MFSKRKTKVFCTVAASVAVAAIASQALAEGPSPTDTASPSTLKVTDDQLDLAASAISQMREVDTSGKAEIAVLDYSTYTDLLEADVKHETPLLDGNDEVVVVAVDGEIDISDIRWAPDLTGEFEAPEVGRGVIAAYDKDGGMLSRMVLFNSPSSATGRTKIDDRGAIERVNALGIDTVPIES